MLSCATLHRPIGRCYNVQCRKALGCEFGKGSAKEYRNDRLRRRENEKKIDLVIYILCRFYGLITGAILLTGMMSFVSCIRCVIGSAVGRCKDCAGVSDGFPQLLQASGGM